MFQEQKSEIENLRRTVVIMQQTINTMQQQFINGFNFVQQSMNVFNHQSVQQTNMVQNRLNFIPPVQQINTMQQQGLLGDLNLSINAFDSINDINKGGKK